jgi:hypothetical protein
MAIQIGKYKRPGIFIEEFDNSIIVTPTVTGTTTFVAGFSRKGPVNTPVLLQTAQDLERIFGTIDRNLERKGSFFHRTVGKLLESNPVFAMNLLITSDTLDTLEYKSVSTRSDKFNDIIREGAYRRFFDTTGFWKRDTDAFINLVSDDLGADDRLLSFTNMSDKYITIFVFKTKLTGFDRQIVEYYGSADKVPSYLNPADYASDFMVDVVVVGGDWSNYTELSVDSKWAQYFSPDGLDKTKIRDFANDRNVNLLGYYEGLSLIPFFRDNNGRNIFIETIINNDTDRTGLFCAFDMDKFEKDYTTGMVDLIGNNLVQANGILNNGQFDLEFLSYRTNILDLVDYAQTPLDQADGTQQVFAFGPSAATSGSLGKLTSWGDTTRTSWYAEDFIEGVEYDLGSEVFGSSQSITIGYTLNGNINLGVYSDQVTPYTVVSGTKLDITLNGATSGTGTLSIAASAFTPSATTASYTSVVHVDSTTGEIKLTNGVSNLPPTLPNNDVVLNYFTFSMANGLFIPNTVTVNDIGILSPEEPADLTFTFNGTPTASGTTVSFFYDGTLVSTPTASGTTSLADYLQAIISDIVSLTQSFGVTLSASQSIIFSALPGTYDTYNGFPISLTFSNDLGSNINVVSSLSQSFSGGVGVGYNALDFGPSGDYDITNLGSGKFKFEFLNSSGSAPTTAYETWRKVRLFRNMLQVLDSSDVTKSTMLSDINTHEKFSLENANLTTPIDVTTSNRSFEFTLGTTSVPQSVLDGNLVFYKIDNELILGQNGLQTKTSEASATASGVVAKYSTLYQNFENGSINTGDFFYKNLIETRYPESPIRVVFQNEGTFSYVVFSDIQSWSVNYNDYISVYGAVENTGVLQIEENTNYYNTLVDPSTGTTYSSQYTAYKVFQDVVNEDLSNVELVFNRNEDGKVYLKMFTTSSGDLTVDFVDDDLSTVVPINIDENTKFVVNSNKTNYKQTVEIEVPTGYTQVPNKILVKGSRYTEIKIGDYLEAYVDPSITLEPGEVTRNITKIVSKRAYAPDTTLVEITCDAPIEKYAFGTDLQTLRYTTIEDYVTTYQSIPLKGFRVREASMPDGSESRQSAILNLIAKGTPLFKALTNKEAIDFRYVIDSFGLGLVERSKQQLVDICGQRLDCFGFINMPSMKMFKNSTSPTFVDSEGVLQTSFIAQGGNPESSPAFLYSFGDGRGVSSVGYFLPYVTVNDNGRPADIIPSPYVASTYLRKINTNTTAILPWTIAAGVTNGRVTNIAGIEINFSPEDIENLNGAQMNPLVFKRNRGYIIETENTAQTLYRSALSFIHVREVLIELERELSAMLLEFQWRFNTSDVRAEIKLRADTICEKYVNKNGLFNYFNKCDEENNTTEIIDNQIGVLDTYVEPIRAMGVIVNNITILRTGAIAAGGFQNA